MADKRRYLSRTNDRGNKPIAPTGGDDIARDGYAIRSREPLKLKRSPRIWDHDDYTVVKSLKTEDDAMFDSYLMD